MNKNTKSGVLELSNKKFCFNEVRLSVKCWFFVFSVFGEEHTTLNTQSDSIKAKLFICQFKRTTLGIFIFIDYFYLLIICTETFTRTFTI